MLALMMTIDYQFQLKKCAHRKIVLCTESFPENLTQLLVFE